MHTPILPDGAAPELFYTLLLPFAKILTKKRPQYL